MFQVVFRKIADVKRERELAETRKNEGLDQISSDHPVRKLISKFRKISQESRAASQNISTTSTPPNPNVNPPAQPILPPIISLPTDSEPTGKTRDKLETISERIETQESQISQITSLNQSPPLWKWLKTGSTGPETDSPPRGAVPSLKPSPPQQHSTNPFDSNLTEEDLNGKTADGSERRPSIPLSLFIPRAARNGSLKIPEEDGNGEHVKSFLIFF